MPETKIINKLAYSDLTDEIYFFDDEGKKHSVNKQSFIQAMLLWLNQGDDPPVGTVVERELKVGDITHWKIMCQRLIE